MICWRPQSLVVHVHVISLDDPHPKLCPVSPCTSYKMAERDSDWLKIRNLWKASYVRTLNYIQYRMKWNLIQIKKSLCFSLLKWSLWKFYHHHYDLVIITCDNYKNVYIQNTNVSTFCMSYMTTDIFRLSYKHSDLLSLWLLIAIFVFNITWCVPLVEQKLFNHSRGVIYSGFRIDQINLTFVCFPC